MENKSKSAIESVEQLTTIAQNLKNLKQDTDILRETNIKHNLKPQTIQPNMTKKEQQKEQIQEIQKIFNSYLQNAAKDMESVHETTSKILKYIADDIVKQIELFPPPNVINELKKTVTLISELNASITELQKLEQEEKLPRVTIKSTDELKYPLDKANSRIWDLINIIDREGQIQLSINTSKKGSNQNAEVLYGINFDELESDLKITKRLTPFDKRCYIAVAALYNGGNDIVSATQIYKMMGNRGQPKAVDIEKINDSLTKMGAARVLIDNTKEVQINKKYDLFSYDASLLPFERINAYINNTLTESAIHLFREPPLVSFAKSRKQITSLPRQLLESPVSKTEANLRIDDYLIARIAHMKKNKSKIPRKILYATIFDRCDITTANQRSRAPEKIHRYLAHYRECEFIKNFRQDKDGIIILF